MNHSLAPLDHVPHLTPARLVGLRFGRDPFGGIKVALVGYCPRPRSLDKYQPRDTTDQYFIHVPPANVQICRYPSEEFLSITHVYGGPVSAALIEELAYYGITYVLACRQAVALGSGTSWQSTLAVMLSTNDQAALDPLTLAGKIVEFYVEVLMPTLR